MERLKIEFLKQMQAEERRVQEELQVLSAVLRRPPPTLRLMPLKAACCAAPPSRPISFARARGRVSACGSYWRGRNHVMSTARRCNRARASCRALPLPAFAAAALRALPPTPIVQPPPGFRFRCTAIPCAMRGTRARTLASNCSWSR